jgi:hypothetical protein
MPNNVDHSCQGAIIFTALNGGSALKSPRFGKVPLVKLVLGLKLWLYEIPERRS